MMNLVGTYLISSMDSKTTFRVMLCVLFVAICTVAKPQSGTTDPDLLVQQAKSDSTVVKGENGSLLVYKKPKPFSFITQVPKTLVWSAKLTFRKESIPALAVVIGSTLLLVANDQRITNNLQHFGRYVHLDASRKYGASVNFKLGTTKVTLYDVPKNANSAIYSMGEGLTSVVLSGYLFTAGNIKRDFRMIQTASQIMQAQLTVGLITQAIKRISGRESPFRATAPGGEWRPLPRFSTFQSATSHYDAFPSGHLASMMATVTVLGLNYPEKKWIRPTGYGLISLVGFAMINNGVHWAGDYPLALGIGYITGKATVHLNRWIQHKK